MKLKVKKKKNNDPELETLYLTNTKGTWVYQRKTRYHDEYIPLHGDWSHTREHLLSCGYQTLPKGSKIIITV